MCSYNHDKLTLLIMLIVLSVKSIKSGILEEGS
jgi:hypothetical protein